MLLTVISSLNYHLAIVGQDTEETRAALLGRAKLDDPEFAKVADSKGSFAPEHPGFKWQREISPVPELPGVSRISLTVSWNGDKNKLSLVKLAPQNAQ